MASLYNIQQDLLTIYDKIEQQDGEILPEDEQALAVTQENFREKLEGYNQYMGKLKTDVDACKQEEKRIKSLRESYESRLNTAKKVVLDAVQKFGVQTKTGGYAIEFPTFKFSTRRNESVIGDEKRLNYLYNELKRLLRELYINDMLTPHIDWDIQGLCDTINANIKAEMDYSGDLDYYIPFTTVDLQLIDITIECGCNLESLFTHDTGIAHVLACDTAAKSELSINKTCAKEYLKATEDINIISCCHKEANYSLQTK